MLRRALVAIAVLLAPVPALADEAKQGVACVLDRGSEMISTQGEE